MEILAVGTGGANAGNIFVCDSTNTYTAGVPATTTKVFDMMLPGDNVDASSQFTIPAGCWGMVVQIVPAINDVTAIPKFGRCRVGLTDGQSGVFLGFDLGGLSSNNNPVPIVPMIMTILKPKSDIRIQAQVSAATEAACINGLIIWPQA